MQAAAPNLRKIKIILEGLPNTDDAYLKNELEINKILPLNIVKSKMELNMSTSWNTTWTSTRVAL